MSERKEIYIFSTVFLYQELYITLAYVNTKNVCPFVLCKYIVGTELRLTHCDID